MGEADRVAGDGGARVEETAGYTEQSDIAYVRKHAAADEGSTAAGRIGAADRRNQSGRQREVERVMSEKLLRNWANHGLLVLAKALPGASGSLALERMQKRSQ